MHAYSTLNVCCELGNQPLCDRIDHHGVVKVADFGLTEDMYVRNYFRHDKSEGESEEKVPIRWMAPESIESDVYTERTDVVRTCIYGTSDEISIPFRYCDI